MTEKSSKKEEGLAAIAAANPKWSKRHVQYAHTLMPTSSAVYYEKGSKEYKQAHAHWLHRWTLWAIEMNLLPDDTPVPPETEHPPSINARRSRNTEFAAGGSPVAKITLPPTEKSNDIKAPREGTVGKKIWDVCDEVTTHHGRQATVEEVLEIARTRGLNEGNTRTEFTRWRKFHT